LQRHDVEPLNAPEAPPALARRLNSFDATLIVMGGIVGAGIFQSPAVVAARVHSPLLIMAEWAFGGLIALIGAFIFAELAWRRPDVGGLYAYLRDAFHPAVAFMYGWTALFVSQSGGMAVAALTFALYFGPLTHLHVPVWGIAAGTLAFFTAINCFGVREGSTTQNVIMVVKLAALAALIGAGIFAAPQPVHVEMPQVPTLPLLAAMGGALIPVLYAYDGWQTASFMSGECKDPARSLPRGLVWGVVIVIALYMAVNAVSLRVLGPAGLAGTTTPASDIMRIVLGPIGERVIALFVAISTLGFLSNQILTSPRIYYAMANDGLFFRQVAWLHPKTRVPIVAVVLQAVAAILIVILGNYGQILNYVTSVDFVFFALAAVALFVFRRRSVGPATGLRVPGHPWTTGFFCAVCVAVVGNSYHEFPRDTLIGLAILLSAVPIYYLWKRFAR
jgi:APA family basic amino acid/polyamine antiporter